MSKTSPTPKISEWLFDILENGILTCKGVIADTIKTGDLQSINLNVENNITGGESLAIGRDVAVGRTLISPNIFTTKLLTNTIETKNVKDNWINLFPKDFDRSSLILLILKLGFTEISKADNSFL